MVMIHTAQPPNPPPELYNKYTKGTNSNSNDKVQPPPTLSPPSITIRLNKYTKGTYFNVYGTYTQPLTRPQSTAISMPMVLSVVHVFIIQ